MKDRDIKSFTRKELEDALLARGEKAFRAAQIYSWMHEKLADRFEDMTDLSVALRKKLAENYVLTRLEPVKIPIRIGELPGTGYEVQFAIPLAALGLKPETGTEFRFDIGFGDSEDGRSRARQFMWSGSDRNARDRSGYGRATLIN